MLNNTAPPPARQKKRLKNERRWKYQCHIQCFKVMQANTFTHYIS